MPPLFPFDSRNSDSPLLPASLLDRAEGPPVRTPPPLRPSREEIERQIAARRRRVAREDKAARAGTTLPEPATTPLDEETQLYNRRLAQKVAEAGRTDGIAPILKNALEHDPEGAEAQVAHLLDELHQQAPEQAETLERELGRGTSEVDGAGPLRSRVQPPVSGKRQGEFYRGADEAIQDFIDFAQEQGLYELLPSDTREALDTALDAATLLPGPGKLLVFAEFATLIAPAVGHLLDGDLDAAARATTDAVIFLPAALVAGRRGGKLAVAGSRQFRTGGGQPPVAPLAAGAAVSQAMGDGEETLDLLRTQRYEAIENPPSSSPPPLEPLPPEDRAPYREELVPPDLEDLLTRIPPTPGFTLADIDDIVEIFPDQRDEIPPILVLENRKGSQPVQAEHRNLADFLIDRAKSDPEVGPLSHTGGGPDLPETYFGNREQIEAELNPRVGSSYLDLTFTNDETKRSLHINTIDTRSDEVTPDSREEGNGIRAFQNIPNSHLFNGVPKAKAGEMYDQEALYQALRQSLLELKNPAPEPRPKGAKRAYSEDIWIKIPPKKKK